MDCSSCGACARLAELTAPSAPDEEQPWNTADRIMRTVLRATVEPDGQTIIERLAAPQIVRHDRRRLHQVSQRGTTEIIEALGAFELGTATVEIGTIATRGERLVLHSVRTIARDDRDGAALDLLHIGRIDANDLGDLAIVFDADDLGEATTELDRLYAESGEVGEQVSRS